MRRAGESGVRKQRSYFGFRSKNSWTSCRIRTQFRTSFLLSFQALFLLFMTSFGAHLSQDEKKSEGKIGTKFLSLLLAWFPSGDSLLEKCSSDSVCYHMERVSSLLPVSGLHRPDTGNVHQRSVLVSAGLKGCS